VCKRHQTLVVAGIRKFHTACNTTLADPGHLPSIRFTLHPSLRIMESRHAVVSLWGAHQDEDVDPSLAAVDAAQPESALLLRSGLEVETYRIAAGTASFIRHL
jgi:hypothetical protein